PPSPTSLAHLHVHAELISFFLSRHRAPQALHSFPTRRSSDLNKVLLRAHPPNFPKQQAPRGFWVAKLNHHGAFTTPIGVVNAPRSEEHTSELQSRFDLVCRLLLEKKKRKDNKRKQTDKTQHDA